MKNPGNPDEFNLLILKALPNIMERLRYKIIWIIWGKKCHFGKFQTYKKRGSVH